MGIFRNERADELAKAAGKRSTAERETLSTSGGENIVWTKANEQRLLKSMGGSTHPGEGGIKGESRL